MVDKNYLYEKAELIYAANKKTPLFGIVAENRFNKGKNEEAKEILEAGISHFPYYATAYFLFTKILIAEGKTEKAREKFNEGKQYYSNDDIENYYEKLISGEVLLNNNEEENPILQELNEEILPEKPEEENEEEDLATETLASVFEQQGAYEDAIETYKKLMKKFPENYEKYELKIAELIEKQANS